MPSWVADLVFLLIFLGMAYALVAEGAWGATLMFFNCLFSGLVAFNFYEPLAGLLAQNVEMVNNMADSICMLGLYVVTLFTLRILTDQIAPGNVRFPTPIFYLVGLVSAIGASAITTGIVLLGFQSAPVHKQVFGTITYDKQTPFGLGLDHKWLGLFQFSSGVPFAHYGPEFRADAEYGSAPLNLFDPKGDWLLRSQEARPVGEAPAEQGGDAAGGGTPTAAAGGQGLGIPGGTAGAAAGLAAPLP